MFVNIGDYCLTIFGEEVSVTDVREPLYDDVSKWTIPPTVFEGLSKITKKGFFVRLCTVGDGEMTIINIVQKGSRYGFGLALNLDCPEFSEFGDTGLTE